MIILIPDLLILFNFMSLISVKIYVVKWLPPVTFNNNMIHYAI